MKNKMKKENRSQRYDINKPEAESMGKLSKTEADLRKNVACKKSVRVVFFQ